jgi:hypothetical protein
MLSDQQFEPRDIVTVPAEAWWRVARAERVEWQQMRDIHRLLKRKTLEVERVTSNVQISYNITLTGRGNHPFALPALSTASLDSNQLDTR